MRDPIGPELKGDKQVLDALLSILTKEEQASGLPPSPEFLGIADVTRMKKSDNFRSNRRPNPRPPSGHENRIPIQPNFSKPDFKPNYGQDNNFPHAIAQSGGVKNWRSDRRSESARSFPGPFPPNRYDPSARNIKGKDLGNLKFRTGIPEVDFMTRSSVPIASEQERGQYFRNDPNRGVPMRDNGPQTVYKSWRNEAETGNKVGYFAKKKAKKEAGNRNRGNQTPNPSGNSVSPRLADQSVGKPPSEVQVLKHPPEQAKKVIPKESAQFAHGCVQR